MASPQSDPPSVAFYRLQPLLKQAKSGSLGKDAVADLVKDLRQLVTDVERSSIFSANEDVDDILTEDLKYLLLPQMVGDALALDTDMTTRAKSLQQAIVSWQMFLSRAGRYNLISPEDFDAVYGDVYSTGEGAETNGHGGGSSSSSGGGNAAMAAERAVKISRFKRDKELEEKVEYFFGKVAKMKGNKSRDEQQVREEEAWGNGSGIDEELVRECILNLLRKGVLSCIEEIQASKRELPMLEMFAERQGQPLDYFGPDEEQKKKPWQINLRDPSEVKKWFQNAVFQPDIPMPTVTLAEYADCEMAKIADQQMEKEAKVVAEYTAANCRIDGQSADPGYRAEREEEEAKENKQRKWDDWVDFNPRGAGNKNKNTS
mmetsp:Transcript_11760/g.28526  ORF Transcript_11760/g.28526 Transcript_11760/m.28526 type:complete len:374 (-) Transcript_11760:247-1368(-)|eukprot:CAMPEP_0178991736 /NCGR_PEP_ID=MMETSP0795-20121207/5705_1 /TAXON_ID=88552 /ORGANISM="Amoebophrya sp., Strain Ameob2" /LENGTH=373 /DNA_ID=CAMNT_0020683501 /DNA_START=137 /DNA_END=1258 /DNA_ORIENTATION=+